MTRLTQPDACQHTGQLRRIRRNLWDKLQGIKEVYLCQECGQKLQVK